MRNKVPKHKKRHGIKPWLNFSDHLEMSSRKWITNVVRTIMFISIVG